MHRPSGAIRHPHTARRALASAAAVFLGAGVLVGGGSAAAAGPAAAAPPVLTIVQTSTGTSLTRQSVGFSFEASDLALPGFAAGNLGAYLKTLGSSVIRVGGNTVDQTFWTSTGETAPSWSIATITPADLTALAGLAHASGWKVILGVNLKQYSPTRAADEAAHAVAALGTSLQAIEIGNEPDLYSQYSGNAAQYVTDFHAYLAAIEKAAPGVPIEGTDAASLGSKLQSTFLSTETALSHPDITELTSHYYPLSACGGATSTIAQLLGTTARNNEQANANTLAGQAAKLGLPAVSDEGNSVVCEGQPGVSDVFAAALWEVDDQLVTARQGVSGDYMHGTVIQCDTGKPLFMYYTPLCAPTAAAATAGNLTAQPEYYGMAAVHEIGVGDFLNVTNPSWATVRGYAVKHADGSMTVVLDDVQDPATSGATTIQLALGANFSSGERMDLKAGGLSAKTGITIGGQTVQSDGTLPTPVQTPFSVSGNTSVVSVPAGSVAILTYR